MQTRLDERVIEHAVFFAAGHKGVASQICSHSSRAVLSVKPRASRATVGAGTQ